MEKRAPKNSSDHASDPPVAHYRPADRSPRFLPVVLEEQRIPGRLADAAHRLVDVLGLSAFDARYFRGRSHRVLKQSTSGTCMGSPYMMLGSRPVKPLYGLERLDNLHFIVDPASETCGERDC
jgi:hypothetical protein